VPAPEGVWGMPPEMLKTLPGYDPDVAKNRADARKIMQKLGYRPDKRFSVPSSRSWARSLQERENLDSRLFFLAHLSLSSGTVLHGVSRAASVMRSS
jgi:hypothetical protein